MRDLRLYRLKRDPDQTPEPFGADAPPRALPPDAPRHFVVQQHDATRMHWDLRLEIDGVLVSWAVPRGPSLDPQEKRLAVQTEDHPMEYGDFEGVIPTGNYGAGAMIVWDRGTYHTVDGQSPAQGLESGKLDLFLAGHKLRGRFALVRTARGEGREWLLFKKGAAPEDAREIVESAPESVYSGLGVAELDGPAELTKRVKRRLSRSKAPKAELDASTLRPMLATREQRVFHREGWLFELKYDGVRTLAEKRGDATRLFARTGGERTRTYPEIAVALSYLPIDDAILDGELVVLDESGKSSFERIQRRFTQSDAGAIDRGTRDDPVLYYAFDLLAAGRRDLRGLPLETRKAILAELLPPTGPIRFADHVVVDGPALFEAAQAHGLEGVVGKQASSKYEAGQRSKRWLKFKAPRTAPLAIVGVVPGQGSRGRMGSVSVAWLQDGEWSYAGNVGSGLDEATIDALLEALEPLRRDTPAFRGRIDPHPRGAWWVEPTLVCEVRFTEVTSAGVLRQPVFVGLRSDLPLEDCVAPASREAPAASAGVAQAPAEELKLTRLDKVFWPLEGYTKGDLLGYYEEIWPWLAPYLEDRPLVLTRYPDGIEGKSFYQKNAPDFTPEWAGLETIDGTDYFVCNELRTLLYVINSGAIPLHVWSARRGQLDRPDWCILDLDPKEAPFEHVVEIARSLHALLDELGARHFVKTSGQDGLHVMLPLGATMTHRESRTLAEALARTVVAELPEIATVTRPLAARGGKVYVDFGQNGRGQLIVAPFSVRPRAGAPVSTPLTWRQVTRRLDPSKHTIRTTPRRMREKGDPFAGVLGEPIDAEAVLTGLIERLG